MTLLLNKIMCSAGRLPLMILLGGYTYFDEAIAIIKLTKQGSLNLRLREIIERSRHCWCIVTILYLQVLHNRVAHCLQPLYARARLDL